MSKTALFVRHKAKPGLRDEVRRIWEHYVKPRVAQNPGHDAYFFCYDASDPDVVCVFQLYSSEEAMQDFLTGAWYASYLNEIAQVVAAPPQIMPADLIWKKPPE